MSRSAVVPVLVVCALLVMVGCGSPPPVARATAPPPFVDAVLTPEDFEFPAGATVGVVQPQVECAFTERATLDNANAFRERKQRNALLVVERFALEKGFTVLSRTMLGKVLEEHGLQLTAPFDEETAAKLGKLSGAQCLLLSTVDYSNVGFYGGDSFFSYRAFVRLVKVETGQVMCTINWSGRKRFGDPIDPDEL